MAILKFTPSWGRDILLSSLLLIALSGCSSTMMTTQVFYMPVGADVIEASCTLQATSNSGVSGTVRFIREGADVRIVADLKGLTPGKHGFHIHQLGDLSEDDGTACAGHFNPENHRHGSPKSANRHLGDLGNIEADASGNAHYEHLDPIIELYGPHSVIGRSIIVHADADDLRTQPTGNAGARIAQGVIGISKVLARPESK